MIIILYIIQKPNPIFLLLLIQKLIIFHALYLNLSIKSFHHLHNICLFIGSLKTGEIYSSRDIFQIRPSTDAKLFAS